MALGYRAGAVGGTTTGTSASFSITVPSSGTGGTVVAGDVAIVCFADSASVTVSSAPSGWNARAITTNAQSNITAVIYTKTLVSGDINAAASWTMSGAGLIAASVDVFSGADESTFLYSSLAVGTGTTVTSPTITVPSSGFDFGFWAGATTTGAPFTFTKDASYTAASTRATSVASGANRTIGTAFISGSGSTAGVGCTFSVSTARNAAFSVALGPSAGTTPVTLAGGVIDLAVAPLAGSVSISVGPSTAADLAIAKVPNGTVNAAATLAGASPPGTALAPLAGTVTSAQNMVPSVAADLAVTAPVGVVHAAVTLAGITPPGIAIAPQTGAFGGALTVTAATVDYALAALQGDVLAQAVVTLAGVTPPGIALAPLAGTVTAAVTLAGDYAPMGIEAPRGTVFGGIPVTLAGEVAHLSLAALPGIVGPLRSITLSFGAMATTWAAGAPSKSWSASEPETNSAISGEIRR